MPRLAHCVPAEGSHSLTRSEEEYLEAIYRLEGETAERVKVRILAKQLRVKDPSVVEMLKKLSKKSLVTYDRFGVKLTERGKREAVSVVRRHRLAERLLSEVFGHSLPGMHEHACEFEHILDDELAERIEQKLGKPATCPHGNPIPTPDGKVTALRGKSLTEVSKGEECVVMVIPEERGSIERLLSLNILPGTKVRICEKLPRGAVMLQCGSTQVVLSWGIASKILVGPLEVSARK